MKNSKVFTLVMASMFAALICVVTMFPHIPTPATNGYIHAGDAVVLLAAWLLGPLYGSLAAGIGSALADLLSGYPHYVPGTFFIKLAVALVAALSFAALKKLFRIKSVSFAISAVFGESIMILGYFLYSSFLLGSGVAAAVTSIPSNAVQALFAVVVGVVAARLLCINKTVLEFFPKLRGFDNIEK